MMKYKDLLRIRSTITSIVKANEMSAWEQQKAKENSRKTGGDLIGSYKHILRCRNLMGSLA